MTARVEKQRIERHDLQIPIPSEVVDEGGKSEIRTVTPVNFDTPGGAGELQDGRSVDESGALENAGSDVLPEDLDDPIVPELLSGSSVRPSRWKARIGALMSRSLSVSIFRRHPRGVCCTSHES